MSSEDDPRVLREEIERTREQLGATVEALAAKADVKSQAKQKVSQLTDRLTTKAGQAKEQATAQSGKAQRQLADKTAAPRRKALALIGPAVDQVRQRATRAATSISKATPKPVKQAAGNAAATARRHRIPLAAGAVGAAALGWLLIRRRRRR